MPWAKNFLTFNVHERKQRLKFGRQERSNISAVPQIFLRGRGWAQAVDKQKPETNYKGQNNDPS